MTRQHLVLMGLVIFCACSNQSPEVTVDGTESSGTESQHGSESSSETDSESGGETETGSEMELPEVPVLQLELAPVKQLRFSWGEVDGAEYFRLYHRSDIDEGPAPIGDTVFGSETA